MYQTFETTADPSKGATRLAALRGEIATAGLDGFIVPRADAYQGEYVAACDARLAWLTGFTGSAGFAIALAQKAGVFVDGRYRNQVRGQVDLAAFTPVDWPEVTPGDWLRDALPDGGRVGYDAMLHTEAEIAKITEALAGSGVSLAPCGNLIDRVWPDRPAPPAAKAFKQPIEYTGQSDEEKLAEITRLMAEKGAGALVITLPDSLSWLLNIRGTDVAHNPVVQGFLIVESATRIGLFAVPSKFDDLGPDPRITLAPMEAFLPAVAALDGPVMVDPKTAPIAVLQALEAAGREIIRADDPCILPKARKTAAEIAGAREAHLRDGAALVEFLTWYDATANRSGGRIGGGLTEIDLVVELESQRRATGKLRDISFETIAGSGPNGAIMHYRVTQATDRRLAPGDLVVLDSGGQYVDGTTDITRTLPVGEVGAEERTAFTRVLQGMIAISRVRFPKGVAGRDIDALARYPLWLAHMDFNHGTGHGVGSYLSVHEGPQRISRVSDVALDPGMILSNEPGYYRDGAFGIRIENLVVVEDVAVPAGGDDREMRDFETLTFVPIDRRLIVAEMLAAGERDWLNAYHAEVLAKIGPRVSEPARVWLSAACAPI